VVLPSSFVTELGLVLVVNKIRIGIGLGGTKIEVIALDAKQTVRARHRSQIPRNDYAGTLRTIS